MNLSKVVIQFNNSYYYFNQHNYTVTIGTVSFHGVVLCS